MVRDTTTEEKGLRLNSIKVLDKCITFLSYSDKMLYKRDFGSQRPQRDLPQVIDIRSKALLWTLQLNAPRVIGSVHLPLSSEHNTLLVSHAAPAVFC